MPACPELIELAAWRDGRLADEALAQFEVHLARCDECRALLLGVREEETDRAATDDPRAVEASIARAIAIFGAVGEEGVDGGTGGAAQSLSFGSRGRHHRYAYAGRVAVAAAAGIALAVVGYRVGSAVGPLVRKGERTMVTTSGVTTSGVTTSGVTTSGVTTSGVSAAELPFMIVDAGPSSPTVLDLYLALDSHDSHDSHGESRP